MTRLHVAAAWFLISSFVVSVDAVDANCSAELAQCDVACCNVAGCSCSVYTNRNGMGFGTFSAEKWCEYSFCVKQTGEQCVNSLTKPLFDFNSTADQYQVAVSEWDTCLQWGCDLTSYEHALLCISRVADCTLGTDPCNPQCKAESYNCRLRFNCAEDLYSKCLVDSSITACPARANTICGLIFSVQAPMEQSGQQLPMWLLITVAVSGTTFLIIALTLCIVVRSCVKKAHVGQQKTSEKQNPLSATTAPNNVEAQTGTETAEIGVRNPLRSGLIQTASVAQVSLNIDGLKGGEGNPEGEEEDVEETTLCSNDDGETTYSAQEQEVDRIIRTIQTVQSGPGTIGGQQKIPTPEILLNIKSDRSTFDKWQKGHLIGKGSFGEVYLGILHTGLFVAVKIVDLTKGLNEKVITDLLSEVSLMRDFTHPNITQYLDVEYDRHLFRLNIFMEFVDGGAMSTLVKRLPTYLDESLCKRYTIQILKGLVYLHGMGVVHRDIKGENVLVRTDGVIKLADFGCSKKIADVYNKNKGCSTLVGTPYWMAPEVIGGNAIYGSSSDIWSVGCTVSEMLNRGAPPWPLYPTMWAAIYHIASANTLPTNLPTHVSPLATSFMHACLVQKPEDRPSAEDLLTHPFLSAVKAPNPTLPQPGRLFVSDDETDDGDDR